MARTLVGLCCFLIGTPGLLHAADGQQKLSTEVLAVFAAKCARCHGPDVRKPKGRFGYVLDLGRIARNREMIVPGSPGESELWELVRRDEMPPPDSPTGPLSAAQKKTICAWIKAGAPARNPGP